MRYVSTRSQAPAVTGPEAILAGLAPDGGLYVPERLPEVPVAELGGLGYPELASAVIGPFLPELADRLPALLAEVYATFDAPETVPVRVTGRRAYLELFHGPTAAFKDMALQVLPRLLTASRELLGASGTSLVLTATSGDTGKAALAGFADVPGTEVVVLYPTRGVSAMQKHQMATQAGANVHVIGIEGNFDDAQRAVKSLFADADFVTRAKAGGYALTSANSINLGRLLPQVAYYVHGWHALLAAGALAPGEDFEVVVPTGNFGNILAATWARALGVPVARLVCAANTNRVLADFLQTGTYDARRTLAATTSPSMDILVSSNLERFLHGLDAAAVPAAMASLATDGAFTWAGELPAWMVGGWAGEEAMAAELRRVWEADGVLLDPHTAVAGAVASAVAGDALSAPADAAVDAPAVAQDATLPLTDAGDTALAPEVATSSDPHAPSSDPGVASSRLQLVAATASPYKFAPAVLAALGIEPPTDDFAAVDALHEHTGVPVPESLAALRGLPVLHDRVVPADGIVAAVSEVLGG